jgi:hypothetical protein
MKQIGSVNVSEVLWGRLHLAEEARRRDLVFIRQVTVPNDTPGSDSSTFVLYHGYDGKLTVFQVDPNSE